MDKRKVKPRRAPARAPANRQFRERVVPAQRGDQAERQKGKAAVFALFYGSGPRREDDS